MSIEIPIPSIIPTSKLQVRLGRDPPGRNELDRLTLAEYSINESNEAFTMDAVGNRSLVNVRDGNSATYVIDANTNRYHCVGASRLEYEAYLPHGDPKMHRTPLISPLIQDKGKPK